MSERCCLALGVPFLCALCTSFGVYTLSYESRHFHVDHAAAIPYITEQIRGFSGKVFATDPTIAVLRLTLSDSVRVERAAGGGVSARTSESLDAASGAATKGSSAGGHS